MKVLVINAGSSSLKYQLVNVNTKEVLAKGLCERIGIDGKFKQESKEKEISLDYSMESHAEAIKLVLKYLVDKEYGVISDVNEIKAVGHRIVNGGEVFSDSVIMDKEKLATLETLTEFAPLHNPPAVVGIKACMEVMGEKVPQVTVFDTSFHQSMPKYASIYGLPYTYYEKYGIRRFGAHGTSHRYVALECAKMMDKNIEDLKIVTCHLGNGSSITAVDKGKSIDTSMGFTPLAGVLMGTRCGDIDPAIVTYIMEKEKLTPSEMADIMNKESGVYGISGESSDFRDVWAASKNGNKRAKLALEMFAYQVRKYIGAYAAAMGGIDALVFTAGIGENDYPLRELCVQDLSFLGIDIDSEKNKQRGGAREISKDGAKVHTFVIPTNEEYMIAMDTKRLVEGRA